MAELTQSVTRLVNEFAKLPGIGKKSAERLAYHILRIHRKDALELADAIRGVKDNVQYCRKCYNLAEGDECVICRDPSRDEAPTTISATVGSVTKRTTPATIARWPRSCQPRFVAQRSPRAVSPNTPSAAKGDAISTIGSEAVA